jgi:transposase, IS5 family
LIVKNKLGLDDRGTIQMIQENIYLQHFCGLPSFTTQPVFDASLFVDIRKRLGGDEFDAFNQRIIESSEQIKPPQSRIKRKQQQQKE